jgi:hypothetical protein
VRKGFAGVSEGISAIRKTLRAPRKAISATSFPGSTVGKSRAAVGRVGSGALPGRLDFGEHSGASALTPALSQGNLWERG